MSITQAGTRTPVGSCTDRGLAARVYLQELADPNRLTGLDDEALMEDLAELAELGQIADAGRAFAAGAVADRSRRELASDRLCVKRGCASAEELISQTTRTSTTDASRRIRQAEPLQPARSPSGAVGPVAFPLLRAAVSAGLMSADVSTIIARALRPGLDGGLPLGRIGQAERVLVAEFLGTHALAVNAAVFGAYASALAREAQDCGLGRRGVSVAEIARHARTWHTLLAQEAIRDVDGESDRQRLRREQQMARRSLKVWPEKDGTCRLEGELLPDTAAQLTVILDAYGNPKVVDTRRGVGGDPAGADTDPDREATDMHRDAPGRPLDAAGHPLDPRTHAQRQHDYFAGLISLAAGLDGVPRPNGGAPTLLVTVTQDQLLDPHGQAFLAGTHDEDSSAVDLSVAHHAGCAGHVMRLLTTADGRAVSLSILDRVFDANQRKVLTDRDGGCIIPGCTVPANWCEAHHVQEWQDGGRTDTSNGTLLCYHHHRELGMLGWDIQMRNGLPWVRPPAMVDPEQAWRPGQSSAHRYHDHLRRRHGASPGHGGTIGIPVTRATTTTNTPSMPVTTCAPAPGHVLDVTGAPAWARPPDPPDPPRALAVDGAHTEQGTPALFPFSRADIGTRTGTGGGA